jgi:hypothetical protein
VLTPMLVASRRSYADHTKSTMEDRKMSVANPTQNPVTQLPSRRWSASLVAVVVGSAAIAFALFLTVVMAAMLSFFIGTRSMERNAAGWVFHHAAAASSSVEELVNSQPSASDRVR